jgi:protein-S-isoprenylcysteine O-methyltransferase Ste14
MRDFLAVYLPVYFLLFFGVAFVWRTWRAWKMTGINAYRLPDNPGVEQVTSRYFRLMPFLSLTVMVIYLLPNGYYAYIAPIYWLEISAVQVIGIVVMSVALVLIVVAQSEMGASWRIGVDHEHETEFVQRGMFKYSRNPIFLGILLSVVGYFLILPNALTLLIMMLDLVLIQVQVRVEEEHLKQVHGKVYTDYCMSVRRWI